MRSAHTSYALNGRQTDTAAAATDETSANDHVVTVPVGAVLRLWTHFGINAELGLRVLREFVEKDHVRIARRAAGDDSGESIEALSADEVENLFVGSSNSSPRTPDSPTSFEQSAAGRSVSMFVPRLRAWLEKERRVDEARVRVAMRQQRQQQGVSQSSPSMSLQRSMSEPSLSAAAMSVQGASFVGGVNRNVNAMLNHYRDKLAVLETGVSSAVSPKSQQAQPSLQQQPSLAPVASLSSFAQPLTPSSKPPPGPPSSAEKLPSSANSHQSAAAPQDSGFVYPRPPPARPTHTHAADGHASTAPKRLSTSGNSKLEVGLGRDPLACEMGLASWLSVTREDLVGVAADKRDLHVVLRISAFEALGAAVLRVTERPETLPRDDRDYGVELLLPHAAARSQLPPLQSASQPPLTVVTDPWSSPAAPRRHGFDTVFGTGQLPQAVLPAGPVDAADPRQVGMLQDELAAAVVARYIGAVRCAVKQAEGPLPFPVLAPQDWSLGPDDGFYFQRIEEMLAHLKRRAKASTVAATRRSELGGADHTSAALRYATDEDTLRCIAAFEPTLELRLAALLATRPYLRHLVPVPYADRHYDEDEREQTAEPMATLPDPFRTGPEVDAALMVLAAERRSTVTASTRDGDARLSSDDSTFPISAPMTDFVDAPSTAAAVLVPRPPPLRRGSLSAEGSTRAAAAEPQPGATAVGPSNKERLLKLGSRLAEGNPFLTQALRNSNAEFEAAADAPLLLGASKKTRSTRLQSTTSAVLSLAPKSLLAHSTPADGARQVTSGYWTTTNEGAKGDSMFSLITSTASNDVTPQRRVTLAPAGTAPLPPSSREPTTIAGQDHGDAGTTEQPLTHSVPRDADSAALHVVLRAAVASIGSFEAAVALVAGDVPPPPSPARDMPSGCAIVALALLNACMDIPACVRALVSAATRCVGLITAHAKQQQRIAAEAGPAKDSAQLRGAAVTLAWIVKLFAEHRVASDTGRRFLRSCGEFDEVEIVELQASVVDALWPVLEWPVDAWTAQLVARDAQVPDWLTILSSASHAARGAFLRCECCWLPSVSIHATIRQRRTTAEEAWARLVMRIDWLEEDSQRFVGDPAALAAEIQRWGERVIWEVILPSFAAAAAVPLDTAASHWPDAVASGPVLRRLASAALVLRQREVDTRLACHFSRAVVDVLGAVAADVCARIDRVSTVAYIAGDPAAHEPGTSPPQQASATYNHAVSALAAVFERVLDVVPSPSSVYWMPRDHVVDQRVVCSAYVKGLCRLMTMQSASTWSELPPDETAVLFGARTLPPPLRQVLFKHIMTTIILDVPVVHAQADEAQRFGIVCRDELIALCTAADADASPFTGTRQKLIKSLVDLNSSEGDPAGRLLALRAASAVQVAFDCFEHVAVLGATLQQQRRDAAALTSDASLSEMRVDGDEALACTLRLQVFLWLLKDALRIVTQDALRRDLEAREPGFVNCIHGLLASALSGIVSSHTLSRRVAEAGSRHWSHRSHKHLAAVKAVECGGQNYPSDFVPLLGDASMHPPCRVVESLSELLTNLAARTVTVAHNVPVSARVTICAWIQQTLRDGSVKMRHDASCWSSSHSTQHGLLQMITDVGVSTSNIKRAVDWCLQTLCETRWIHADVLLAAASALLKNSVANVAHRYTARCLLLLLAVQLARFGRHEDLGGADAAAVLVTINSEDDGKRSKEGDPRVRGQGQELFAFRGAQHLATSEGLLRVLVKAIARTMTDARHVEVTEPAPSPDEPLSPLSPGTSFNSPSRVHRLPDDIRVEGSETTPASLPTSLLAAECLRQLWLCLAGSSSAQDPAGPIAAATAAFMDVASTLLTAPDNEQSVALFAAAAPHHIFDDARQLPGNRSLAAYWLQACLSSHPDAARIAQAAARHALPSREFHAHIDARLASLARSGAWPRDELPDRRSSEYRLLIAKVLPAHLDSMPAAAVDFHLLAALAHDHRMAVAALSRSYIVEATTHSWCAPYRSAASVRMATLCDGGYTRMVARLIGQALHHACAAMNDFGYRTVALRNDAQRLLTAWNAVVEAAGPVWAGLIGGSALAQSLVDIMELPLPPIGFAVLTPNDTSAEQDDAAAFEISAEQSPGLVQLDDLVATARGGLVALGAPVGSVVTALRLLDAICEPMCADIANFTGIEAVECVPRSPFERLRAAAAKWRRC
jgi:hypothetical protein